MRALKINESAIPVRFNEVDSMQVAHHSQYFIYMEVARLQFAQNVLGIGYADFVTWGIRVPVRRCHCEYLYPARFGDTVVVQVTLKPSETASLHLRYRMFREQDRRLLARGETVNVFIDEDGKLLVRTPEILRERIARAIQDHPDVLAAER